MATQYYGEVNQEIRRMKKAKENWSLQMRNDLEFNVRSSTNVVWRYAYGGGMHGGMQCILELLHKFFETLTIRSKFKPASYYLINGSRYDMKFCILGISAHHCPSPPPILTVMRAKSIFGSQKPKTLILRQELPDIKKIYVIN